MRSAASRIFFSCCLIGLLSFGAAWAQRETGSLGGTVVDQTGAVLPGADVTVTNQGTRVTRTAVADENGRFVVANLPPGSYTVRIQMPGFQAFQRTDIPVESARDIRDRYMLSVGEVTETITVQGGATLVSTVGSEQRVGLDSTQVAKLPMANRNITGIIGLNPAVVARGGEYGGTGSRGIRLSGVGQAAASYTMDGIEASGQADGNNISQYQGTNRVDLISSEGVQEVQVIKGVVPAEHANTISGVINVITKSGTRDFHGSAFHLYKTHGLNARDPFLGDVPRPILVFNQFGGSVGGPMYTGGGSVIDSAFFFFAFEGYEERQRVRRQGDVPTQFARDQIFASSKFDDRERQILHAILDPLPLPNRPETIDADGLGGQFASPRASEGADRTWMLKNDVHFSDGSQLAFTWNRLDPDFLRPGFHRFEDRIWADNNNRFAASYFASLSPSWNLESRFGLSLIKQDRVDLAWELVDPVIPEETFGFRRLPSFSVPSFGTADGELRRAEGTTYSLDQKAGYIRGNHSIKFGGNYRINNTIAINPEIPAMSFDSFADLLENRIARVNYSFGQPNHDSRIFHFGFFVQDDWRVTDNLTLNLGFRYDFISNFVATRNTGSRNPTPRGSEPLILNLTPPTDWAIFNFGPALDAVQPFEHDKKNFSPKVGFNWDVSGEGKTVVRGGAGMMHMPLTAGLLNNAIQDRIIPRRSQFSRAEIEQFGVRLGTLNAEAADIVRVIRAGKGPITNTVFNPLMRAPYTINWTLGIQKELFQDAVVDIDYVGQRGVKFPLHRNANQPARLTGIRPNPNVPGLDIYIDDSQMTTYHGLQTGLRKRFSQRLAYGVSYAWGKSIALSGGDVGTTFDSDNVVCCQDFDNIALARGRANGDIAHNFTAHWYYQLPGPADGAARNVLGGWNFSGVLRAQDGVAIGIGQRNNGGRGVQRGDVLVSDFDDARFDDFADTLQYWNPAAFAPVPLSAARVPIRPGNTNRAFRDGPGFWTVDVSFAKEIFVAEETKVSFRWDWFNSLNHFNHANPRSTIDRSRFGAIENFQQNMRVTQLGLRVEF